MEVAETPLVVSVPVATECTYSGGHSYGGTDVVQDFRMDRGKGVSLSFDYPTGSSRYVQVTLSKGQCFSYGLA